MSNIAIKDVSIPMVNYKGEDVTLTVKLKKFGSAFNFYQRMLAIRGTCKSDFEADFKAAVEYLPNVVGKEFFVVPGLNPDAAFAVMLEEFFINDPFALQALMGEVSFFLYPAMSRKLAMPTS